MQKKKKKKKKIHIFRAVSSGSTLFAYVLVLVDWAESVNSTMPQCYRPLAICLEDLSAMLCD